MKAEVERHEKTIGDMRAVVVARDAKIAELSDWLPVTARKAANRERHDGNDDSEAKAGGVEFSRARLPSKFFFGGFRGVSVARQ